MPAQFSFKALKDLNIILGLISVLEVELASTLFSMCKRKCNLQSEASQASFTLALLAWKQINLFQLLICKDYLLVSAWKRGQWNFTPNFMCQNPLHKWISIEWREFIPTIFLKYICFLLALKHSREILFQTIWNIKLNYQSELWRKQQAWAGFNRHIPPQRAGMPSITMVSIGPAKGITFASGSSCRVQSLYCVYVGILYCRCITPLIQNPMQRWIPTNK